MKVHFLKLFKMTKKHLIVKVFFWKIILPYILNSMKDTGHCWFIYFIKRIEFDPTWNLLVKIRKVQSKVHSFCTKLKKQTSEFIIKTILPISIRQTNLTVTHTFREFFLLFSFFKQALHLASSASVFASLHDVTFSDLVIWIDQKLKIYINQVYNFIT